MSGTCGNAVPGGRLGHVEVPRFFEQDYWAFAVVDGSDRDGSARVELVSSFIDYGGYVRHAGRCSLPSGEGWLDDLDGSVEHPWVVCRDGVEIAASDTRPGR